MSTEHAEPGDAGDGTRTGGVLDGPVAALRGSTPGSAATGSMAARAGALAGIAVVLGAFLSVLHEILVVTGDPSELYPVVGAALVAGTLLAGAIRPRTAAVLAGLAVVGGTYYYVTTLPGGFGFVVLLAPMVDDAAAMLGGLSVLRIVNADVWALTAAPGPVFLAWYLGLRRRYVAAGGVAGAALGTLVLTGDATTTTTLAGAAGVTLAVAFGQADRRREVPRNVGFVVVVVAAMVVATVAVGVVPGADESFVSSEGFGSEPPTVESSLVHAGESAPVAGPVELSPAVRYTVEADRPAYWRVATYDRYTGGGWVRTGDRPASGDGAAATSGRTRRLVQTYTAESSIATVPAANHPVAVRGPPVPIGRTAGGTLEPAEPLRPGDSYTVVSEVPEASPAELRTAGTDYPDGIEARYTQLPDSLDDRVATRTDRITAGADSPYGQAVALEEWFTDSYEYSLEVQRPRGDVTEAFLFEMDAGYCTYFATSMVTMLRTQGIPARFVVGYTTGERTGAGEWTVRGLHSHAWVEVYVPGHGWIEFDPTPPGPREDAERRAVREATGGPSGAGGSDPAPTTGTDPDTPSPTPTADGNGTAGIGDGVARDEATVDGDEGWSPVPARPSRGQVAVGLLALLLVGAAARRTGLDRRVARAVWLRRRPAGDPEAVVAGAYRRVVHLEEGRGRRKAPGETPRQFLAGADERARRVGELYELATYGGGVDRAAADEAMAALASLLDERTRLPYPAAKRDTGSR